MKHKSLNLLNLSLEKHIRERNCFRCGKKLIFEDFLKNKGLNDKDIKSTMSTGEYAKKEKVHPDTVRRWIKEGIISSTKTKGGHYRIPV